MAKIIKEGGVVSCDNCLTEFSFELHEVGTSTTRVPAGYSPEEEAYDKPNYHVQCPKCRRSVNVANHIGPAAKASLLKAAKDPHSADPYL